MTTIEKLRDYLSEQFWPTSGNIPLRAMLATADLEFKTLQKQVKELQRDKGLLMELCVLKNDALQLAHDNWSDCFHDAVSTCKICKARDADLPKEKT